MSIFTSRGLKIQLDNPYCYTLMQRPYPSINPFKVLKTAEDYELIKDIYILFAVIFSTIVTDNYLTLGIIIFCASLLESTVKRLTWRSAFVKSSNSIKVILNLKK
jgi:hypothetical protein